MDESTTERSLPGVVFGVLVALIVLAVVGAVMMAVWAPSYGGGGWMMGGTGWGWMWPFGGLMMVAVVLVVLLLFYPLARGSPAGSAPATAGATADPITILKVRYAKGEISREQYDQMARDLSTGR